MAGEAEIGSILREAREKQNQSIQNAVEVTKIRSKYLLALENGQFEIIPGQVYVKGFIRSYAKFLGLNGEELVERFKAETEKEADVQVHTAAENSEPGREVRADSGGPEREVLSGSPRSSRRENYLLKDLGRLSRVLLRLAVAVVLIFAIVSLVKAIMPDKPPVTPPAGQPSGQNPNEQPEPPDTDPNGEPEPPAATVTVLASDSGKTVYGVSGDTISVTITAESNCWVGVYRNPDLLVNDFASQVTLRSGDSQEFSAATKLSLRTGNTGGIRVSVNGVDLGVPGEIGIPKTLVFEKQ
ncbi:MAG: RodZ domain-containing protein [bacterium]|jgi:cytoskeleton protein RodZ